MSIYFKISEKKTSIDPDMVCEEIFPNLKTSCQEVYFEFYLNLGLS
jgi:hypothetical protein